MQGSDAMAPRECKAVQRIGFRAHPSRRGLSAAPQDEVVANGEMVDPRGEEARSAVSNHEAAAGVGQLHRADKDHAAFAAAPCAWLSIVSITCGHIGIGNAWPMPSIINSFAPGIEAAVSLPPSGRTSGSTVP